MEEWKIIPDTNDLYEASNLGNIRRVVGFVSNNINGGLRKVGGKNLSAKIKRNGYKEVQLFIETQRGKMKYVHRLVAAAFITPKIDGLEINHINGVKSDNTLGNLEVVTSSQNRHHSYHVLGNRNLIARKGEDHPNAKTTELTVLKVREEYSKGISVKKISKMFNIPFGTICDICYRNSWNHI